MATTLDLTPAVVNVVYYAADGRTITLDYGTVDVDDGRTWTAQIKAKAADTTVLGSFTITQPTAFTVRFTPDDDTRALDPGTYVWDIQHAQGGDPPITVLTGSWTVRGDVSR